MALNIHKETRKHKLEEDGNSYVSTLTEVDVNNISLLDLSEAGPSNPEKKSKIDIRLESPTFLSSKSIPSENMGVREDVEDMIAALPPEVNIMKFVEARASEIAFLTEAIKKKAPKQACQQLPNHMRRRAASHNPNRLPRRLRRKAMRELQKVKKTKRPSRKYRRRPSNLLLEYNRRQRKHIWLETHIWFAKRFKMTELWGYKLPVHPTDKSERAAYRATVNYALMQDISYYGCIELAGKEEILQHLNKLTSPETGLTFQAKLYLDGTREGTTMMYHQNRYPYGFIGPVKFLWKAQVENTTNDDDTRKLWLWVHPSCYKEVVDELLDLFKLDKTKESKDDASISDNTHAENIPIEQIVDKSIELPSKSRTLQVAIDKKQNICFERISSYSGDGINMVLLKDVLVRHRLIGPQALSIIANILKLLSPACLTATQNDKDNKEAKWWEKISLKEMQDLLQKKLNMWEDLQIENSVSCLPSGTVIGLTVLDPRLRLPSKRSKIKDFYKDTSVSTEHRNILPSPELAQSFIWNATIRDEVTFTKIPEAVLNKMRSANLVPGSSLELGNDESRIPILLIQQPGNKEGYGCGWDIIIPAGWSMAFWIALVYRGARTQGLRASRFISLESGLPFFPYNFPDTQANKEISEKQRLELISKYYRYPPDKRPSFKKLGIAIPFFNPWVQLVNEWKQYRNKHMHLSYSVEKDSDKQKESTYKKTEEFFVVRNKCCLKKIDIIIEESKKDKSSALMNALLNEFYDSNLSNSLICVRLVCLFKGSPDEFSSICLPLEADLETLKQNPHFGGPIESVHKFKKEAKVKKKKSNKTQNKNEHEVQNENKLENSQILDLMTSSSRKIFGYIESGGFSLHCGHGCGIGHCTSIGLMEAIHLSSRYSKEPVVLIRKHDSFQYRFCKIRVVTEAY